MLTVASVEPLSVSEENTPTKLADLAGELLAEARDFDKELPRSSHMRKQLRHMVRLMNCYYSNLIEGNNTRPADIEKAMESKKERGSHDYFIDEAIAHVELQEKIDNLFERGEDVAPASLEFIKYLHKNFYKGAGPERLRSERPDGTFQDIRPGYFRSCPAEDVMVGRHKPPRSEDVGSYMAYYAERYTKMMNRRGSVSSLIAVGAAHHRFNHIHPFIDGNGRVGRLISHAMFRKMDVGVDGLWSISRGLARGLEGMNRSVEYKNYMQKADVLRRGDTDGRGTLSLSALEEFCEWFLRVALDQVKFMRTQFNGQKLQQRYESVIKGLYEGKEREHALEIIKTLFIKDAINKGDLPRVLGCSVKTARNRIEPLLKDGFVVEDTRNNREPYKLGLPKNYHGRLFPKLVVSE
ncbi:Fic family protein [Bombella pollinis]|uniref:Fic family protein n=1 Tax=Bombella pollinis TaxID=2967337 RepID=A0ABT3WIJ3_9PROT|nr:Fic family protein [Bombella pollinis]MCX5618935.1 Fic family protein [Bombella pollinis]